MIDQGSATVIASVCGLAGVVATGYFADRRAGRNLQREQQQADRESAKAAKDAEREDQHEAFSQSDQLMRYVRDQVAAETAPLRQEIKDLRSEFRGRLARIRSALRAYILEVQTKWPSGSPPDIHPHLRELLIDDDLDNTTETAEVRRLAADIDRSNDRE